jgi:hypothetical protein
MRAATMSTVERDAEAYEERVEDIRNLLAENAGTIMPDDPVEKNIYAIAFEGWRAGRITGTAQEIFEAAKHVVDEPHA